MAKIQTPFTKAFGIERPISLAGMNVAAGPELVAAVTNAGGLGVLGGVLYTPDQLRALIREIKDNLKDKNAPFGVDLLLPQVGGGARKTNYDYNNGQLDKLIDVMIEEKARLFVSAVGVCPKPVVERLHKANILVMNMIGHPKHVPKALEAGVDLLCAQGGEAGGHTNVIPTFLLIPACVELCEGKKSPLTGEPIQVIAAGGVYNGKTLAAALALGATGVWVGTRFVCAEEAGASQEHQRQILSAGWNDTRTTLIYTGRPLRARATPFINDWEDNRQAEIKKSLAAGKIPVGMDDVEHRPHYMGVVAALIDKVEPAEVIMKRMVDEAAKILRHNSEYAKL